MTLEVCCGSLASAMQAVQGGAGRIELCSALALDGLTPSIGTLCLLRDHFPDLRIHVLIRPREGNFVYSEDEVRQMEADIRAAATFGATAIVSGALTTEHAIDIKTTRRLMQAAPNLPFTFHRAFDRIADQAEALEQLVSLGCDRVLTSGGAPTAEAGIPRLRNLVQQAAGRILILPGGGVNSSNARRILDQTGATEIHGSCSRGTPEGLSITCADEVRAVMNIIRE